MSFANIPPFKFIYTTSIDLHQVNVLLHEMILLPLPGFCERTSEPLQIYQPVCHAIITWFMLQLDTVHAIRGSKYGRRSARAGTKAWFEERPLYYGPRSSWSLECHNCRAWYCITPWKCGPQTQWWQWPPQTGEWPPQENFQCTKFEHFSCSIFLSCARGISAREGKTLLGIMRNHYYDLDAFLTLSKTLDQCCDIYENLAYNKKDTRMRSAPTLLHNIPCIGSRKCAYRQMLINMIPVLQPVVPTRYSGVSSTSAA